MLDFIRRRKRRWRMEKGEIGREDFVSGLLFCLFETMDFRL